MNVLIPSETLNHSNDCICKASRARKKSRFFSSLVNYILTAILLSFPFFASSQIATKYTFSQSAGTYSAISGGTVFASTSLHNMDNEVSAPIAIPDFTFDGVVYTTLYINTNGYITFGKSPSPENYHAISDADSYSGAIAAFSADLIGAGTGTAEIRYQKTGNEFVIQWKNVSRAIVLSAGSVPPVVAVTGEHISFQIRLDTADNRIRIIYGETISPGINSSYPEVGLRGPDNTFATNVNNRKVISTTGPWLNSTTGTANTSSCYFNLLNAATVPAAGTTFTWTPPALDIQATTLAQPGVSGCYSTNETISVAIRNNGSGSINFSSSPATVSGSVTGPDPVTFTPVVINSGTLAPNATQNVILSSTYNMSIAGNYTFNASVSMTGDAYASNDVMQSAERESHTPVVTASQDTIICFGQSTSLNSTATAFPITHSQSNTTALAIPDNSPTGVNSTIVVSGAAIPASLVSVRIDNLAHTFDGDLILKLIAPDGSFIILSNEEGDAGSGYVNTLFSDSAVTPISAGSAPFTGTFLPEDPFSTLTGFVNGTWTLNVSDNAGADVGTLFGWTLIFSIPNGIASYQWNPSAGLSIPIINNPVATPDSTTTYVVTVTDASGCTAMDSVTVTVNQLPEVNSVSVTQPNCLDTTGSIVVNATGDGVLEYRLDNGTFQTSSSFGPLMPGNYNITVRLQSNPDCITSYSGNPVVLNPPDNENPHITCPLNIHTANNTGTCGAVINAGQATATDNCPGAIVITGIRNDNLLLTDPYPVGTTIITWKAMDGSGNLDSCLQTVQIDDNEKPHITCPAGIHVGNNTGTCAAIINIGQATATDNCPGAITITGIRNDNLSLSDPYPVGTTIIKWKAMDSSNNLDSCPQNVQVDDNERPHINCPANIHVSNTAGMCGATITISQATATDNCSGVITISGTRSDNLLLTDSYPIGTTTIKWKAADISGNLDSCVQTILVDDNENPVIVCQPDIVVPETPPSSGQATVNIVAATATDNCPNVTIGGIRSDALALNAPYPAGVTTILWTATDASGKTDTCHQSVRVQPACHVICPADTTVKSSVTQCGAIVSYPVATTTGNCGTLSYSPPPGSFFPVGINTVTITSSAGPSCTFHVTVLDTVRPTISCPANVIIPTDNNHCNAVFNFISPATTLPSATDNCSGVTMTCTPLSGSTFPIGTTTITCTAKDASNNSSSCSFTVTVNDMQNPFIQCPSNVITVADLSRLYASSVATGTATATDNCGIQTITGLRSDNLALSANYPIGTTVITWRATDVNGRTSVCTQTITVNKRITTITYTGDTAAQYSDRAVFRALLKDQLSNSVLAGRIVTFNTGVQNVSAVTNASGIATVNPLLYQSPRSANVITAFPGDSIYSGSTDNDLFKINKENAEVIYTGPEFVNVPCSNCNTTSILLSASIKDISSAIPPGDPNPGDIRKARVRFVNDDTNIPISPWLTVGLVSNSDSTRGTISYPWTVSIPSAGYIDPYTVRVEADSGNYTGSTEIVINVSRGSLTNFISGGGHVIPTLSTGQYASDPLKKINFGFNVKYTQSSQNLQGKISLVFRRTQSGIVHIYQLKGNVFNSLSVNTIGTAKNATFTCRVTLKDITNTRNPVTLGTNLPLQVIAIDRGWTGTNDSVGFTLWNNSNVLLYSSNWISTKTVAKNLTSGNIIIYSSNNNNNNGNNRITEIPPTADPVVQKSEMLVMVMPNPTINYFTLVAKGGNMDRFQVKVIDISGNVIEVRNNLFIGEAVEIGNEYKSGIYFIHIIGEGENVKTVKILKQ